MFGQSLLSGAFGTALVPDENFGINLYTGSGANQTIGGKIKGAASFNGSSSYITLPNSIETPYITAQEFGVSMWFKIDALPTGSDRDYLISLYQEGYLDIRVEANGVIQGQVAEETSGTNRAATSSSGVISANTWHHVVFTGETNNLVLYVDDSSVATQSTWNGTFFHSNAGCSIGSRNNGTDYFWDGSIDQVRIFNTKLTTSQITSLYAETASNASTLNFPAGAGCYAAYQLDTNATTILSQTDLDVCNFPTGAGCQTLYQFSSDSTDTCGNYNGTNDSGVTYNVPGVFGNCAQFGGGADRIDIDEALLGGGTTKIWSTSMWVKTSQTGSEQMLNNTAAAWSKAGYAVYFGTSGNLRFQTSGAASYSGYMSYDDQDLFDGKWHHIVATYSSAGGTNDAYMYLYVDGVNVTSDVTAGNSWVQGGGATYNNFTVPRITLGNWADSSSYPGGLSPFVGEMDQVRFFNTALTQSQVTELARGTPKYNGAPTAISFNGWTNFKPGFTWFKKRNGGTGNNLLQNSPGLKTSLSSNATYDVGYYDQYGYLSSFGDQGFATAGGSSGSYPYDNVGESGSDYVSWNWKAGAETYSTYFNGIAGSGGSYAYGVPAAAATALRTAAAFSISIWVNPDQTAKPGTYDPEIVRFLNNIYLRLIYQDGGTVQIYVSDSTNTGRSATSSALTPGKWTHVCATGSSSGLVLYIDGTQVDTDTWDGTFVTYSSPYYQNNTIGSAENTGSSPPANPHSVFKGYLSQYRLYNTQLTSTQVSTLYNETAATNATLNYPAGAGAIALYQLKGNCTETSGTYSPTSEGNLAQSRPNYLGGNTEGSVPSQVNANPDAGFSIVKFINGASGTSTMGHGLGKAPELIIMKQTDSSSTNWVVYNVNGGAGKTLVLNGDNVYSADVPASQWGSVPTATLFTVTNNSSLTNASSPHIAYCWTSIDKYSKIGSYTGNNPTAVSVDLGFAPSWIMVKNTSTAADWVIYDNKRSPTGNFDEYLLANSSGAEGTTGGNYLTPTATGFTTNSSGGSWVNENGATYIYIAFA